MAFILTKMSTFVRTGKPIGIKPIRGDSFAVAPKRAKKGLHVLKNAWFGQKQRSSANSLQRTQDKRDFKKLKRSLPTLKVSRTPTPFASPRGSHETSLLYASDGVMLLPHAEAAVDEKSRVDEEVESIHLLNAYPSAFAPLPAEFNQLSPSPIAEEIVECASPRARSVSASPIAEEMSSS